MATIYEVNRANCLLKPGEDWAAVVENARRENDPLLTFSALSGYLAGVAHENNVVIDDGAFSGAAEPPLNAEEWHAFFDGGFLATKALVSQISRQGATT